MGARADYATKSDVTAVRDEVIKAVDAKLDVLRVDLETKLEVVRSDLDKKLDTVRDELRTEMHGIRDDLRDDLGSQIRAIGIMFERTDAKIDAFVENMQSRALASELREVDERLSERVTRVEDAVRTLVRAKKSRSSRAGSR